MTVGKSKIVYVFSSTVDAFNCLCVNIVGKFAGLTGGFSDRFTDSLTEMKFLFWNEYGINFKI